MFFRMRHVPALLAATLYVLLGVSAAWHAPHFSRGAEAIGVDGHAHHEAVKDDACALCTFKSGGDTAYQRAALPSFDFHAGAVGPVRTTLAAAGFVLPGAARGPPSLS